MGQELSGNPNSSSGCRELCGREWPPGRKMHLGTHRHPETHANGLLKHPLDCFAVSWHSNQHCTNHCTTPTHCLSLIHISEPTRLGMISYAVFCLKKTKSMKRFT